MNKQEVIERLNNKLDETFAFQQSFKPLTWAHMECESKANAYMTAINYVEQLDEPQKVKVPEFVVEWFEENKHNLNFAIYELCEAGKVPVDLYEGLTDFERWFYLNHDIDTLIRMQDGYEVEEEPKWVLKHQNGMYFTRFNEEMEPLLGGEKRAYRFTDESKAEALTIFFNGTVEKV